MVNRGARDGHRLDGQDQMLRERAEDLHNKLREQENASGKLRRENEDLKSVSSAQIEELARLHQRLEKARTEYESLAGQLTTLKQAHDAAQTALAQLNDAQSKQGNKLESKAQALEAAQVTVAKLKEKNVAVERQLASVSESLAREAKGRAAAEGQASELAGVRNALEQELAEQKRPRSSCGTSWTRSKAGCKPRCRRHWRSRGTSWSRRLRHWRRPRRRWLS